MPLKLHTFSYGISQNVTFIHTLCVACVAITTVIVQRNANNAIKVIAFQNEPYHSVSFSFILYFSSDNLTLCPFSCNNTFVPRVYTKIWHDN